MIYNSTPVCCFTGHRPRHLGIKTDGEGFAALMDWTERIIVYMAEKQGVCRFISGAAMGSDIYFAEAVIKYREKHRDIILECAVPFRGQADRWNRVWRARYENILQCANIVTYLQNEYDKGCYERRNRYMVDNSDYVAAIWKGTNGGTRNTIKYAQGKNKRICVWDPIKAAEITILPRI